MSAQDNKNRQPGGMTYTPEIDALLDFLWNEMCTMDAGDHCWLSWEDSLKLEQLMDAIPCPSNPEYNPGE